MSSVSFDGLGDVVKNGGEFLLALYDKDPFIAKVVILAVVFYPFYAKFIRLIQAQMTPLTHKELFEITEAEKSRRLGAVAATEGDGGLNE